MEVSVVIIGKIIEGALNNDLKKVKAYTELAIEHLEKDGDLRAARILKNKLNRTNDDMPKVVLD